MRLNMLKKGLITRGMAIILSISMALPLPAMAVQGGTTENSGLIPFGHSEMIVPIDGTAPDNTGGRAVMIAAPLSYSGWMSITIYGEV